MNTPTLGAAAVVKTGAFDKKQGEIVALAEQEEVPKHIGVRIPVTSMIVWFQPDEIEILGFAVGEGST